MINKKQKIQKGFTLIEVLIAVFILITAVVVPLTIGSKGIFYSNFVRDQSIASYLAQEGMEVVRLARDNTFLRQNVNVNDPQTVAWGLFRSQVTSCTNTDKCGFDFNTGNFDPCSDLSSCKLKQDANDRYVHDDAGAGKFKREISIKFETVPLRARVDVTVSWKTNTLDREITVTNYLMPWQI